MSVAPDALSEAIAWLASILTGTIGDSLAVLAVATLGLTMLRGRLAVRDGARIVMGCFILFGAQVVANGLVKLADISAPKATVYSSPPSSQPALPSAPTINSDPYAGASVPMPGNP